jgi:hypothetical protein
MVCVNGGGGMGWVVSGRDGIEATFTEGMAAREAAEGQPGASDDAETDEGHVGVLGAGGEVEALRGAEGVQDGGEDGFVDSEGYTDG